MTLPRAMRIDGAYLMPCAARRSYTPFTLVDISQISNIIRRLMNTSPDFPKLAPD